MLIISSVVHMSIHQRLYTTVMEHQSVKQWENRGADKTCITHPFICKPTTSFILIFCIRLKKKKNTIKALRCSTRASVTLVYLLPLLNMDLHSWVLWFKLQMADREAKPELCSSTRGTFQRHHQLHRVPSLLRWTLGCLHVFCSPSLVAFCPLSSAQLLSSCLLSSCPSLMHRESTEKGRFPSWDSLLLKFME